MSTPLGGEHIIFAFSGVCCPASAVRRHAWFPVISRKSIYPILPNLVWVFIGLIACMGLLLVKIGIAFSDNSYITN